MEAARDLGPPPLRRPITPRPESRVNARKNATLVALAPAGAGRGHAAVQQPGRRELRRARGRRRGRVQSELQRLRGRRLLLRAFQPVRGRRDRHRRRRRHRRARGIRRPGRREAAHRGPHRVQVRELPRALLQVI